MDAAKIRLQILEANAKRKINWFVFLVGLVLFLVCLFYLRKANYKPNRSTPGNPYGVSYTEAYNSKQLDTIRDIPTSTIVNPFTPSTSPVSGLTVLGVSNDVTPDSLFYVSDPIELYAATTPIVHIPAEHDFNATITYACQNLSNIDVYMRFQPQLYFQFERPKAVVFQPFNYPPGSTFNASFLVYNDYDVVFNGIPVQPNFLMYSSSGIPPLVSPSNGTQWYSDPQNTNYFVQNLSNGNPNPLAGTEIFLGYGNQSQVPYKALNQIHIVTNGDQTASSTFQAIPAQDLMIPQGIQVVSEINNGGRTYYLRDVENVSDGVCISLIGIDVKSTNLHPTLQRNTWMVLNGSWTILPTFVFFDSSQNENPIVLNISSDLQNIPLSLANLANRWIVLKSNLTVPPTITEPTHDYLNSVLGVPINAFGRQGITIMSSSLLSSNVMPHRIILSARGDTSGSYYWLVLYAAWIAGFVGQVYVSDTTNIPGPSVADMHLMMLYLSFDLTKTFVYVVHYTQQKIIIPYKEVTYSFYIVIVGGHSATIDTFLDDDSPSSFIKTLSTREDTIDTSSITFPPKWPLASSAYFCTVSPATGATFSTEFGLSSSLLQSIV